MPGSLVNLQDHTLWPISPECLHNAMCFFGECFAPMLLESHPAFMGDEAILALPHPEPRDPSNVVWGQLHVFVLHRFAVLGDGLLPMPHS
jgi:hypothetical protein